MRETRWLPYLFLILCGCTIIEDSDIVSDVQLDELELISFTIKEVTSDNRSVQATLLADSAVNISVGDGSFITRIAWYSLPKWNSVAMKFRSGAQSALSIYNSFLSDGKPFTFVLYDGDSAVEIYQFRYLNGKLNKIITTINPVDNLPFTVRTNDSIVYNGSDISSIIRRSPDLAMRGTFSDISYMTFGGTSDKMISSAKFGGWEFHLGQDNCPGNAGISCATVNSTYYNNTGNLNASYTIRSVSIVNSDVELTIEKSNFNNCCRGLDTIYFHPLMFWRSRVQLGASLLPLYIIDWLVLGAPDNNEPFQPTSIDFQFSYER